MPRNALVARDGDALPAASVPPRSLIDLLRQRAETHGAADALHHKRQGVWRTRSWKGVAEEVERLAGGLAAFGIVAGDVVALLGGNRPELFLWWLAVQRLGGIPALPHAEIEAHDLHLQFEAVAPRAILVAEESAGEIDGIAAASLPIIITDIQLAADAPAPPPDLDSVPQVVVFSSGTRGSPRPVALKQADLLDAAKALVADQGWSASERAFSTVPGSWAPGITGLWAASLWAGFAIAYPESDDTLTADLRESGASILLAPIGFYRRLRRELFLDILAERLWRRRLIAGALGVFSAFGLRLAPQPGRTPRVIASALADRLGIARLRSPLSTGGALPEALRAFYRRLGVTVVDTLAEAETGYRFFPRTAADPASSAAEIEGSLFIRHAVLRPTDDGAPHLLLALDTPAIAAWAQARGLAATGEAALLGEAELRRLIDAELAAASPGTEGIAAYRRVSVVAASSVATHDGKKRPDAFDPARNDLVEIGLMAAAPDAQSAERPSGAVRPEWAEA